jgi:hypothetical protein
VAKLFTAETPRAPRRPLFAFLGDLGVSAVKSLATGTDHCYDLRHPMWGPRLEMGS